MICAIGSTVVVRRRFDPVATLRAVAEHRCTAMVLVPTMLRRILDLGSETVSGHDTHHLKVILTAGSGQGKRNTLFHGHPWRRPSFIDIQFAVDASALLTKATVLLPRMTSSA